MHSLKMIGTAILQAVPQTDLLVDFLPQLTSLQAQQIPADVELRENLRQPNSESTYLR